MSAPTAGERTPKGLLGDGRMRAVLAVAVSWIIIGGTVDLALDAPDRWLSFHVIFELLMIAGALVIAIATWISWWRSEKTVVELRASLVEQHAEREAWRATAQLALDGLGRAIEAQFAQWELTPAESEIALLLLKGFGHKQIAAMTGRSERTVRQHASAAYEKSGLGGRAELSAFFLQDLMLPSVERPIRA